MLILQDVTGREKAERERKRAEEDLRVHAGLLHVFHKITSAQGLAFEEKLIRLLRLSCERFKLPIGMLPASTANTMKSWCRYQATARSLLVGGIGLPDILLGYVRADGRSGWIRGGQ